jgi:prephenate dehydrogenase (NADP+)
LLNSQAKHQIKQYSQSTSELFKLMIQEREIEFRSRISTAFQFVFGRTGNIPILLPDGVMDQFSLSAIPKDCTKANSHLSLLAIVDAWCKCEINPYDQLLLQVLFFVLLIYRLLPFVCSWVLLSIFLEIQSYLRNRSRWGSCAYDLGCIICQGDKS